jgi:hypothetical protein
MVSGVQSGFISETGTSPNTVLRSMPVFSSACGCDSSRSSWPRISEMIADAAGSSAAIARPSGVSMRMRPCDSGVGSTAYVARKSSSRGNRLALAILPLARSRSAQARSPRQPRSVTSTSGIWLPSIDFTG